VSFHHSGRVALITGAVLASVARDRAPCRAEPGEPVIERRVRTPLDTLPATVGEAVERLRDGAFANEALGEDVVAHMWRPADGRGAAPVAGRRRRVGATALP